jgi:hypothetical protein
MVLRMEALRSQREKICCLRRFAIIVILRVHRASVRKIINQLVMFIYSLSSPTFLITVRP